MKEADIERVAQAILCAKDDDGEMLNWTSHFYTREAAALFMARAVCTELQTDPSGEDCE